MLDLCGQLPCTKSTPVFLTCGFSSYIKVKIKAIKATQPNDDYNLG